MLKRNIYHIKIAMNTFFRIYLRTFKIMVLILQIISLNHFVIYVIYQEIVKEKFHIKIAKVARLESI